ncbi:MAG: head-tail connector protein [Synergistales bacterium]|nr:head-tail connector protein [Synergistales bacterium]
MYKRKLTTPSPVEPITLSEIKTHLRISHNAEDTYLEGLIMAACEYCERVQGRAYVQQTWSQWFDAIPILFPLKPTPFLSLDSIVATYNDDTTEDITSYYGVNVDGFLYQKDVPSLTKELPKEDGIKVVYTVGYEPDDSGESTDYIVNIPASVKHVIKIAVSHWYAHREPVVQGQSVNKVPETLDALLWLDRDVQV